MQRVRRRLAHIRLDTVVPGCMTAGRTPITLVRSARAMMICGPASREADSQYLSITYPDEVNAHAHENA